jgi:hypothetical protein
MSRALDDLDPSFRPIAIELVARCAEATVPVMIIDTRRTPAQHAVNLANGTSWTKHSKHLDGLAIDVCPYDHYDLHGPDKLQWRNDDPAWHTIGAIGEQLGLRWGGRWTQRDMGHFELV